MVTRDSRAGDGWRQQVQEASVRNTNDADPAIYQLDSSAPSAPGSLGQPQKLAPKCRLISTQSGNPRLEISFSRVSAAWPGLQNITLDLSIAS